MSGDKVTVGENVDGGQGPEAGCGGELRPAPLNAAAFDQPMLHLMGPVEIDGESVTPSQAAILCTLALGRGAVVSVDALMDGIWPHGVPDSAKSSMYNQLARLRSRFGERLILSCAAGYRLGVPTDVEAFEQVAAEGTSLDDPVAAKQHLLAALRLWHGRPYEALVDHPDANCEATRLAVVRQRVERSLAMAHMALGEHARAVDDLLVLVESDPYTESLWELLMTAMVADGRPVEALAAYERLSGLLADDLGIRPSERLVELRCNIAASTSSHEFDADGGQDDLSAVEPVTGQDRGCAGPLPMRKRALCNGHRRIQRTPGEAP